MAECFYKNSGAAVKFFKNHSRGCRKSAELKPAGSTGSHTGPFTDISCAAAGSSLSEQKADEHDKTVSAKASQVIQKGSKLIFQMRLLSNHVHINLVYVMKTER